MGGPPWRSRGVHHIRHTYMQRRTQRPFLAFRIIFNYDVGILKLYVVHEVVVAKFP